MLENKLKQIKSLKEIGLNQTSIKIYYYLLVYGKNKAGEIIKNTKIPSSSFYNNINNLLEEGFLSYTKIKGIKYYIATEPNQIKEKLEDKKNKIKTDFNKLERIIPELEKIKNSKKQEISTEIYQGFNSFKKIYSNLINQLNKKDILYVFATSKDLPKKYKLFFDSIHKKRIKKQVISKFIFTENMKEYANLKKKQKNTQIKIIKKQKEIPVWITISKNQVLITNIEDNNKTILIKDKLIFETYKQYFNALWNN